MRPVGVFSGAATLMVGLLAAGTAGAAEPASITPMADSPTSVTFDTPGEHTYTVPAGVTRVDVLAVGGEGGEGARSQDRRGGRAARIVGTLDVEPGQKLYAVVGTSASGTTPGANGGGAAGGSAAECFAPPGAGGGATDVRTIPLDQPGSDASRVLVAGGGGGASTLGSDGGDRIEAFNVAGGHRGSGGLSATLGGWGGSNGDGGNGGADGENDGTSTSGGPGAVDVAGEGSGCGGGGGGGYGGGGGGAAGSDGAKGGGGGGGDSLVPGGFPAGMADQGAQPSVTFSSPGLAAPTGPLRITSTATMQQNDISGNGVMTFANCPITCTWTHGDHGPRPGSVRLGYVSTQGWGAAGLQDPSFGQARAGVNPAPADWPAEIGEPFLLMHFAHYNEPIRFDSPNSLGSQSLVTVQPPVGPPAVFDRRGPYSIPFFFQETDNGGPCDPDIQQSQTMCDDTWTLNYEGISFFPDPIATTTAGGVTWQFEVVGYRLPNGEFSERLVTEERVVTQADIYAKVTVDTNPTTSTLTIDDSDPDAPVLTMTTAPVPQYGGTVTFTDGGTPIEACTDVAVGADDGITTCTPADLASGAHTFGGSYSGAIGYAASDADPVEFEVASPETTTTLEVTPNPSDLNEAVTLTATVEGSGEATPTGEVAFHVDGATEPLATASVDEGTASAKIILPGGEHSVTATYGGDDAHQPSTSDPATDLTVTCTRTISGDYRRQLRVRSGTTCVLPGATLSGSIRVLPGASLNVEGASVRGAIVATGSGAIRICDSSAQMIAITRATEFVLVGDPDNGCEPNTVRGVIFPYLNTGGLAVIDNTVSGATFNLGNSGAGPLPGQDEPIVTGNHRP